MCLHVKGGSELVTVLTEKQGKGYKGCFFLVHFELIKHT